jgi:hypothetical protein
MTKSFRVRAENENKSGLRATVAKTVVDNHLFSTSSDEAKAVMIRKLTPNKPAWYADKPVEPIKEAKRYTQKYLPWNNALISLAFGLTLIGGTASLKMPILAEKI